MSTSNAYDIESTGLNEFKPIQHRDTSKPTKTLLKATEASEILLRSLKFISLFGIFIGVDYGFKWKLNIRFIITRGIVIFFWAQIFYTHFVLTHQHQAVRNGEVFAIYGIAISAVLKVECFERYHLNITALFNSTLKICKENGDARGEPFNRRMMDNYNFYKFVASLAILITTLYIYYPVKSYIIDGELVQFVPIEIMFVDQSSKWGFFVASGIMATLGMYAIFGTEYMALSFVAVIMNYAPRVDILQNDWIPGYALAIGFSMEMVFYCLMGTKLTVENERFCQIITQSYWYTYDQWSQKLILTLLNEAMNYKELMIGPFAPLSVYTATEIFKSIYSYYTLMMEVM